MRTASIKKQYKLYNSLQVLLTINNVAFIFVENIK